MTKNKKESESICRRREKWTKEVDESVGSENQGQRFVDRRQATQVVKSGEKQPRALTRQCVRDNDGAWSYAWRRVTDLLQEIFHQRGAQALVILMECPRAGARVVGKSRGKNFPAMGCSDDGRGSQEALRRL